MSYNALIPVKGGLGNQMFFYAFFLFLKKKGFKAKLLWFYYIFTKHHSGIEIYSVFTLDLKKSPLSAQIFLQLGNFLHFKFLRRIVWSIFDLYYFKYLKISQTNPYSFHSILFQKNKHTIFFDGFWQNYKYVEFVKDELLINFVFKGNYNDTVNRYLSEMQNCHSVSLHVRRGDYLTPEFSNLNVIKTNDYYIKAIKYIKERIANPIFFVFTDDLIWAKKNLMDKNIVFVEGNIGPYSYIDMFLMSQCKSNIISNSTFSWWGAWLNNNEEKIVIAPSKWTTDYSSEYICPPNWITIKV